MNNQALMDGLGKNPEKRGGGLVMVSRLSILAYRVHIWYVHQAQFALSITSIVRKQYYRHLLESENVPVGRYLIPLYHRPRFL